MKRIGTALLVLALGAIGLWMIRVLVNLYVYSDDPVERPQVVNNNAGVAGRNSNVKTSTAAGAVAAPTAAPGGGAGDDKRQAFLKKLQELQAEAADLPTARIAARKPNATQEEETRYDNLVNGMSGRATGLLEAFDGLEVKADSTATPGTSTPDARPGGLTTIAPEDVRFWSIIALGLLFSLLFIALLQLAGLVMHTRRLAGARRDLLNKVHRPLHDLLAGKSPLAQQVASTAAAVGKLESGQPPLVAQAAKIMAALDNLPADAGGDAGRREVEKADAGGTGNRAGADDDSSWPQGAAEVGREVDWTDEEEVKPHVFPAPVGEYMNLVKDSARRMKPDYMNHVLVEDQENKGVLVLIKDPPAIKDGTSYVVPWMNYFRSEQEYIKNYSNYFDCSEQPVGHVWISKPATVRKVADGWALVDRGVLEVRQQ